MRGSNSSSKRVAFEICSTGLAQSPIDLSSAQPADLPPIQFDYQPSLLKVSHWGEGIEVTPDPGGRIHVADGTYELVQFHFHHPGEHAIDGSSFPMELHLVHRNDQGEVAVVSLLIVEGVASRPLAALWDSLPLRLDEKGYLGNKLELDQVLPADRLYFEYSGSLTTPPCSEGVRWLVLSSPIELSKDQISQFARIFPDNHRPLQPRNARPVALDSIP